MSDIVPIEVRPIDPEKPVRHRVCQIDLVGAIQQHLQHEEGITHILHRDMKAIIDAANLIVAEFEKPERPAVPGMGLAAWLVSDHTGLSSRRMASRLSATRYMPEAEPAYPRDPADFGRCLGLLEACPELRDRLPRMADDGPEWAALVEHWDELEALWREESPSGTAPKLFERMKELLRGAFESRKDETIRSLQELMTKYRAADTDWQRRAICREIARLTEPFDEHDERIPEGTPCMCCECRTAD